MSVRESMIILVGGTNTKEENISMCDRKITVIGKTLGKGELTANFVGDRITLDVGGAKYEVIFDKHGNITIKPETSKN